MSEVKGVKMHFKILPSKLACGAIAIGRQNHWRFKVVNENSYKKDWVMETITEVPSAAKERLEKLKRSGIRFKRFVVAHEAPRLLSAPIETKVQPAVERFRHSEISIASIPLADILVFGLTLFIQIFVQVILLDPAFIVVLEDGTWLEVMTWYE